MTALLCDIKTYGLLKISGKDAKKLLQGQVTYNIDTISATHANLCAHCNPQGRIISLFYLFFIQESYYLLMPRDMVALATAAFKKYAVFYKVELSDASDAFQMVGYSGPNLTAVKREPITIIPLPATQSRYLLVGEASILKSVCDQLSAPFITEAAWQYLNIHDGIPAIYPATSGQLLPHDIHLPALGAVSFDKGCFTGQEIIARMHYRGKPKNHLYLASITSDIAPQPGMPLYSGSDKRETAIVVDVCHEEYNQYSVLLVTDEANAKNNHLFQDGNEAVFFTFLNNEVRK